MQIINKGTTSDEIITQELRALSWLSTLHNFHVTATYLEGLVTLRNSVSRLHEHPHLLSFYSLVTGDA